MASYIARALIEAATWESIQARPYDGTRYPCGCHPDPKEPHRRFYLCDYHDGFDAGVDQGCHDLTAEVEGLRAEVERLRAALDAKYGRAEEIERLRDERRTERAEVERLRDAGDALAKWLWRGGGDLADMIAAVAAWEEARRER